MAGLDAKQERLSEARILEIIERHFENRHPEFIMGRGDDCAIFRSGGQLCASSDLFLEDVHFRQAYFTPEDIGYKSLAVNLSDLAAMGSRPAGFLLNLVLPSDVDASWLDRLFAGMAQLANAEGVMLAGGDLSVGPRIQVAITAFGRSLEQGVFLSRGGAMAGDILFLAGEIGMARIGLYELEKNGRAAIDRWQACCAAHLRPRIHTDAGLILARAGRNARPAALMDVSDGLAVDLPRLLGAPGSRNVLGAELSLGEDKLHREVMEHARLHGQDALREAYLGGEDYALLGACAPDLFTSLHAAIPELRAIGVVRTGGRIFMNGQEMTGLHGFDHFSDG